MKDLIAFHSVIIYGYGAPRQPVIDNLVRLYLSGKGPKGLFDELKRCHLNINDNLVTNQQNVRITVMC